MTKTLFIYHFATVALILAAVYFKNEQHDIKAFTACKMGATALYFAANTYTQNRG